VWIALGYACADLIGAVVTRAAAIGTPLLGLLGTALSVYLVVKYARRHRFLRHLRKVRITAMDLKRRLDAGDHLVIIDLRTALDVETAPYGIPGAHWIAPEALQRPHDLISRTARWSSTARSPGRQPAPGSRFGWPPAGSRTSTL
jgi:hypothetical protein